MPSSINTPKSICILRLSAIGDVCHAVATVQAIQARYPQAEITWVIGKIEAKLLEKLPGIEFIVFDKKSGLRSYKDLYSRLKNRKFDILLHMQIALRASLATLCIRATEKWGFDKSRAKEGQWLFTNRQVLPQTEPHVADGFWGFAQAIGVSSKLKPTWNMPVSEDDRNWCQQQINSQSIDENTENKSYLVISPAASKAERNWLPERYAAVADHAYTKGLKIVLSGGPSEMERHLGEEITSAAKSPIINLIGKTNLPQLLALLAKAKFVLAPDSGPAHMATTVNTPVIGLYAHSNPKRTGPYHSQLTTISVYEELLKKQTGKSVEGNRWGKRVKGENLMALISVESVLEKLETLL